MDQLAKYLKINSLFSGASGLVLVLIPSVFCNILGIDTPIILRVIGANLVVFAAFVWIVKEKQLNNSTLVGLITTLDLAWVLGTAIIFTFDWFEISGVGKGLMMVVALIVGFFAFKQYKYRIRYESN